MTDKKKGWRRGGPKHRAALGLGLGSHDNLSATVKNQSALVDRTVISKKQSLDDYDQAPESDYAAPDD